MSLDLLLDGKAPGPTTAEHHARLHRVLTLVQKCHGTFTVTIARRLTGWEERSLHRYVKSLGSIGLIETANGPRYPGRWQLTQAGKDELDALRRGDQSRIAD